MLRKTLILVAIGVLLSLTLFACKKTTKATPTAVKPTAAATIAASPTATRAATTVASPTTAATIAASPTTAATTAASPTATRAATTVASPTTAAGGTTGDATKGKATYASNCAGCHGANGEGGVGPKLAGATLTAAQITSTVRSGKGIMPAFTSDKISNDDLSNIIAFIQSLK